MMTLHEKHLSWLTERGIEPGLIEMLGLETKQRGASAWLVAPYFEGGKVINHKWRRVSDKQFMMDPEAPLALYNVDSMSGADQVVICEGEADVWAVLTLSSEIPCVSVPNGAPGEESENPWEARRYEWAQRHQSQLDRVKHFVLATDNDMPGRMLGADLAVLLGPERCKFVQYPEGCKDMGDVLLKHGAEAVQRVIDSARPYPIKGLYRFSDYPPRAEVTAMNSRLEGVKGNWPLVMGTTSIITGWSGIGKTTMLAWILGDYLQQGLTCAIGSFETDPNILKKQLRATLLKVPFSDRLVHEAGGPMDQLIEEQVLLIAQHCGSEESEMTLEYLLNCARIAVVRDGAKLVVIDPWNELEHKRRRDETETDYVGRAIRAIKRFARRYNVAVWLVAHPTKPDITSTAKAPSLYSISGSANWANKADYGVVIHRPDKKSPISWFIVDKVRMGLPGREGLTKLAYDGWTCGFILEE